MGDKNPKNTAKVSKQQADHKADRKASKARPPGEKTSKP